ncbi:hypothetical protein Hjap01_03067 [Haloarcula japonica]
MTRALESILGDCLGGGHGVVERAIDTETVRSSVGDHPLPQTGTLRRLPIFSKPLTTTYQDTLDVFDHYQWLYIRHLIISKYRYSLTR